MSFKKLDFQQAKTKHLEFKNRVHSIICGEPLISEHILQSQYECEAGKWLYNKAMIDFAYINEVVELEQKHADMHVKAHNLLTLYKEGAIKDAQMGLPTLDHIAESVDRLLSIVEQKIMKESLDTATTLHDNKIIDEQKLVHNLLAQNEAFDKKIQEQSKELLHHEHFFKKIMEASPIVLWVSDKDANVIYLSPTWFKWTGLEPCTAYGDIWQQTVHNDDIARVKEEYLKNFNARKNYSIEYRMKEVNGVVRWCHAAGQPTYNDNNEFSGFSGSIIDITDRKKAEDEILAKTENERQVLHNFFMQAPALLCILRGPEHIFELTNPEYKRIIGNKDVIGLSVVEAFPELKEQGFIQLLDNVFNNQLPFIGNEVPVTIINNNGDPVESYFNFIYQPILKTNKETDGILVFAHEVTEHMLIRKRIEASEARFRNMVESAPFPIAVLVGESFTIHLANQSIINAWGKGNDIIGRSFNDVLPMQENQQVFEQLEQVYKSGKPFHARNQKFKLMTENGFGTFYYNYSFTPLFDEQKNVYGILNTAADVTDLNVAKQKLEESELKLRSVIEQAIIPIGLTRGAEHVLDKINAPMLKLMGKNDSITGKKLQEILPELEGQKILEILNKVYHTGEAFQGYEIPVTITINDVDELGYYNISYTPLIESGEVTGIIHVASDVSVQVVARKKLENSEARFRLLADTMPQFVWTSDEKGNLNYFNQSVYDYTGLKFEDIQRDGWVNIIHPDERENNMAAWKDAITTGKDFIYEHRFINKYGEFQWQLSRAIPNRDADGNIQFWVGTSTNIDSQKTFSDQLEKKVNERTKELMEVNVDLERSNMELKQFAYVASHDLQEPLRKILTFSNRLTDKFPELPGNCTEYLNKISASSKKMSELINDLLNFSSTTKISDAYKATDLNVVLNELVGDFEVEIQTKNATIKHDGLPVIQAIPMQMSQLFHNLISNALKFSKTDEPVKITINANKISAKQLPENLTVHSDYKYFWELQFTDNGIGFDQKFAEKIFTIFQRLHIRSKYEGTGIGLALCKKIVDNHNGYIIAKSIENEGSTFYVYLPANK